MQIALQIATIIVSIIVVLLILLQGRGAGLGSAWGGGGEHFQTRRGIEKVLMRVTVGIVVFFVILSATSFFISR